MAEPILNCMFRHKIVCCTNKVVPKQLLARELGYLCTRCTVFLKNEDNWRTKEEQAGIKSICSRWPISECYFCKKTIKSCTQHLTVRLACSWFIYCFHQPHEELSQWSRGCQESIVKDGKQGEKDEVCKNWTDNNYGGWIPIGDFGSNFSQYIQRWVFTVMFKIIGAQSTVRVWSTMRSHLESAWEQLHFSWSLAHYKCIPGY